MSRPENLRLVSERTSFFSNTRCLPNFRASASVLFSHKWEFRLRSFWLHENSGDTTILATKKIWKNLKKIWLYWDPKGFFWTKDLRQTGWFKPSKAPISLITLINTYLSPSLSLPASLGSTGDQKGSIHLETYLELCLESGYYQSLSTWLSLEIKTLYVSDLTFSQLYGNWISTFNDKGALHTLTISILIKANWKGQ